MREWVPAARPPIGDPQPDGSWRIHGSSLDGLIFICAARCLGCGLELTPANARGYWSSPIYIGKALENFWPVPMLAEYPREFEPKHPQSLGGCGGRIAFSQCTDPPEVARERYEQQVTEFRRVR